jgi:hypothetical protein
LDVGHKLVVEVDVLDEEAGTDVFGGVVLVGGVTNNFVLTVPLTWD